MAERREGRARGCRRDLIVAAEPRSVALARHFAVDVCRERGWSEAADTVALLVSELATDAVLHSRGSHLRVRVLFPGLRLRLEITDDGPPSPQPAFGGSYAHASALVTLLASDWGAQARADGTTAWLEIGR